MDGVIGAKTGLKTVVAELQADAALLDSMDGEQMNLPIMSIYAPKNDADQVSGPRGRGRPAGAKNKNTKEWREFLLSRYPSPMIALAEMYSRNVRELAAELGYTKIGRVAKPEELLELVKVQMSCAKELLPYVHQKQPQAIDLGEGGMMTLNIFSGNPAPVDQVKNAEGFNLDFIDLTIEENQGVSDAENQKTNGGETNGGADHPENTEENADKPTDLGSVSDSADRGSDQGGRR